MPKKINYNQWFRFNFCVYLSLSPRFPLSIPFSSFLPIFFSPELCLFDNQFFMYQIFKNSHILLLHYFPLNHLSTTTTPTRSSGVTSPWVIRKQRKKSSGVERFTGWVWRRRRQRRTWILHLYKGGRGRRRDAGEMAKEDGGEEDLVETTTASRSELWSGEDDDDGEQ